MIPMILKILSLSLPLCVQKIYTNTTKIFPHYNSDPISIPDWNIHHNKILRTPSDKIAYSIQINSYKI